MTPDPRPRSIAAEQDQRLSRGPVPRPTSDTEPFWSAASRHELHLPFCQACGRYFFYPRSRCRYCRSADVTWREVSGKGRLASYVINHLPLPEFETSEPQVVAIVALDEGVNLPSQIVIDDPTPDALMLDMPLEVVFVERGAITLPFFVPAARQEAGENA